MTAAAGPPSVNEFTRPATWDDLKELARRLRDAKVDYALVGGYAIAAHGFNRFSEDIHILVDPAAENSMRWIVALAELPDRATRALLDHPDVFSSDKRYAVRVNDEFTIDLMPSIAGRTWEQMKPYIESVDLDGVELKLLNLEGLLLTKQGARPKDQLDAALLRQALDALHRPEP